MFKLVASGIAPEQIVLTEGNVMNSRSLTRKEKLGGFKEQLSASLLSQVLRDFFFLQLRIILTYR